MRAAPVALAVTALMGLAACAGGGSSDTPGAPPGGDDPRSTVAFYGYGVSKNAYGKLIPAFQETPEGAGVQFHQSYGPSGDQSRKIAAGAPADFAAMSVEPEVTRLVKAGLVTPGWKERNDDAGVPFHSVVVLVTRPGNPQGIEDWPDLITPGVEVVSPNPLSAGAAKWNLLAPYSVLSKGGQQPQVALDFLTTMVTEHVRVQPKSGREASEAFLQGTGDVLISYENEAKLLAREGEDIEIVHPPQSFRIDTPVAVVEGGEGTEAAARFRDYLNTDAAQNIVATAGFRPGNAAIRAEYESEFPTFEKLWTIEDLGGWSEFEPALFDPEDGAIMKIYRQVSG